MAEVSHECLSIIRQLLRAPDDNQILWRLQHSNFGQAGDELAVVNSALVSWYTASVSIPLRDPQQGMPPGSNIEVDDNGTLLLTWSRRYSHEKHALGSLGIMAMMMNSETWLPPKHPNLKAAALVSGLTTTILLATYLIHPAYTQNACVLPSRSTQNDDALLLFIRISWYISRTRFSDFVCAPGADFGANLNEVKLGNDGRRLLTKIGRDHWHEAPHWHPCRKVPGSAWNKYLKNMNRPVFPTDEADSNEVAINLPSTMLDLAHTWETYYSELRARFDRVSFSLWSPMRSQF